MLQKLSTQLLILKINSSTITCFSDTASQPAGSFPGQCGFCYTGDRKSSAHANGEVDVMERAQTSEPKRPTVNLGSATFQLNGLKLTGS